MTATTLHPASAYQRSLFAAGIPATAFLSRFLAKCLTPLAARRRLSVLENQEEPLMRHSSKVVLTSALLAATAFGQATGPGPATAGTRALPAPGTYAIDPVHTFVYFAAKHLVVGMVRGRFDKMSGTLVVAANPADCSVDVTIETGTVSTQNSVRDEDLRSDAYFDVANWPAATYRGHGIRRSGDGWVMDGTLTIRARASSFRCGSGSPAPRRRRQASRIASHFRPRRPRNAPSST